MEIFNRYNTDGRDFASPCVKIYKGGEFILNTRCTKLLGLKHGDSISFGLREGKWFVCKDKDGFNLCGISKSTTLRFFRSNLSKKLFKSVEQKCSTITGEIFTKPIKVDTKTYFEINLIPYIKDDINH